jgi:hypothetical protein
VKIDDIDREFQQLADSLRIGEEAYQRGDMEQAADLFEQSYEIIKGFGDEHPDADTCMSRLADVYYQQQRFAEATQLLLDLYQLRAKAMSTRHPSFVQLLFRTAKCYERQGLFLEAEYVYLQSLGLLNVTGMPDRAAAANIAESFAKMLRGLDGRMEDAEELEEQARDLRNLTREKLNLEILKRMDFDGVEIVDIDEGATEGRSGIGGLRRRAREMDLEPKSGLALKIAAVVVSLLIVVAGAGGYFAWKMKTEDELKKKKAAAAAAAAKAAAEPPKPRSLTLKTVDGLEQLILFDNGDGTFVSGGDTTQGKYTRSEGAIHLKVKGKGKKDKGKDLQYPEVSGGVSDENGCVLYRPEAREWMVVAAMRRILGDAQASYHQNAGYLATVPTYTNPLTGRSEAAAIKNIGSMDRNVNFEKLERFQHEVDQVLTWTQWSTGKPGCVEIYHYASGEDGDTLYVKGTDEKGVYLRGAAPQQAYVLTLVNGDQK